MKILIIGADGYMGWPLVCQIAHQAHVAELVLLDNCITREKVEFVGGNSITPIRTFQERGDLLKSSFSKKKIKAVRGSVLDKELLDRLAEEKFDVIYHLGHLRTAPYSMSSREACVETVYNNEIGFLNLIWSLKEKSRDTLLIKLGSFGAYAPTGLQIPEEDIFIQETAQFSQTKVPYPKLASDFYHITKANDSLFARAACKNWGLRIVDVMQSTVFGCFSQFTEQLNEPTRLDYDAIYGTVVNRFLVQGLLRLDLSVYGDGQHSSGIMVLEDAINVLSKLHTLTLEPGAYRVINSNPRAYKIIDLANYVKHALENAGHIARISVNEFDPRHEKSFDGNYRTTTAESRYFRNNFSETPIELEIQRTMDLIKNHLDNVNVNVIYPKLDWSV